MKFKAYFYLPTANFKDGKQKPLNVTSNFDENEIQQQDPAFKVKIPDYMFNKLADSEPQFSTIANINERHLEGLYEHPSGCFGKNEITIKFKKTQTARLVSVLQSYISGLTTFLNDQHSVETATLKKKLFIKFVHSQNHTTNSLNGAYQGEQINQTFKYFTGYEVMTEKFRGLRGSESPGLQKRYITKIEYHSKFSSTRKMDTGFQEDQNRFLPLPALNQSISSFEEEYSIIDWTEEREIFCERIKQTFITVNSELSKFLRDLDSDKMDLLIKSNSLKFLAQ